MDLRQKSCLYFFLFEIFITLRPNQIWHRLTSYVSNAQTSFIKVTRSNHVGVTKVLLAACHNSVRCSSSVKLIFFFKEIYFDSIVLAIYENGKTEQYWCGSILRILLEWFMMMMYLEPTRYGTGAVIILVLSR